MDAAPQERTREPGAPPDNEASPRPEAMSASEPILTPSPLAARKKRKPEAARGKTGLSCSEVALSQISRIRRWNRNTTGIRGIRSRYGYRIGTGPVPRNHTPASARSRRACILRGAPSGDHLSGRIYSLARLLTPNPKYGGITAGSRIKSRQRSEQIRRTRLRESCRCWAGRRCQSADRRPGVSLDSNRRPG